METGTKHAQRCLSGMNFTHAISNGSFQQNILRLAEEFERQKNTLLEDVAKVSECSYVGLFLLLAIAMYIVSLFHTYVLQLLLVLFWHCCVVPMADTIILVRLRRDQMQSN